MTEQQRQAETLFIETKETVFGGQKALMTRCLELDRRGIGYRIIHPFAKSVFLDQYRRAGLSGPVYVPTGDSGKLGQVAFIVKSLFQILRQSPVGTIHCDAFDSAYIVATLRKLGLLRQVKLIFTIRSERYLRFNAADRLLIRAFDQLCTNSEYSRRNIEKFGGIPAQEIAITGSPIDLRALPTLPASGPFHAGATVTIGYVGSFDRRKRLDRFVDFAVALQRQIEAYRFRFLIYGEAKTRQHNTLLKACQAQIAQQESAALFHFEGYGKPPEIAENIDILFCPFENEPLGRVVPEFLYMGRDVIAYDDAGLSEAGVGFARLITGPDEDTLRANFIAAVSESIESAPPPDSQLETIRLKLLEHFGSEAIVDAETQFYG